MSNVIEKIKTVDLAKDIVFLCKKYQYKYNNTKVQKLLYLFVGFCLMNDIAEIEKIDELPKIWPFGPFFPKVHKRYTKEIVDSNINDILSIKEKNMANILNKTIEKWGDIEAGKLSKWSREKNSPWDKMVNELLSPWNTPIPFDMIKSYFNNRIENVIENN